MKIKILAAGSQTVKECSLEQFCSLTGVQYVDHIFFFSEKISRKEHERCQRSLKTGKIDLKQKWLGAYYSKEIMSGYEPDLLIAWIDNELGYGVFAEHDILARAYVGKYTGMIRRRNFWKDRTNNYCFDYAIGGVRSSPYVIDAQKWGNIARFINHSDDPNLETGAVYCHGIMHVILYALRPIAKGEQLCYDYGERYWSRRDDLIPNMVRPPSK